jgi:restriction system protein
MAKVPLERIGQIMKAVLGELERVGGEARLKDVLAAIEPTLNLTDYECEPFEKSGYVRWRALVHFYSIDCTKAGYIVKTRGTWRLTEQGAAALKLPPEQFIRSAMDKYRIWKSNQPVDEEVAEAEDTDKVIRQAAYEQAAEQARVEIEQHIDQLGPYEFQELIKELLIAMGYFVPYVAPPGQDGGIDIMAYKDPLGSSTPRIRVQVKHRSQKVTVKEVRELEGLLRKEGDMGLIVSSGGFTGDVTREIRASTRHIETMDLERLISLWEQHYDRISESGKGLLPLVVVHYLAPPKE